MELIDGAVYKTKVGLMALEFNKKQSELDANSMINAGSHVYYDQESDGRCIFGCFSPHTKFYVSIPKQYLENEIELVDDTNLVPKNK